MDVLEKEILSSCFCLPQSLVITSVLAHASHLVIQVACQNPTAVCPLCGHASERIHDL